MTCRYGIHPGLNNTTGKCIACGEFIDESPFKKTMTKKELLSTEHVMHVANGDASYIPLMALNEFLESNVCIPKGEILQVKLDSGWVDMTIHKNLEYRVKPKEPIYEWHFAVITSCDTAVLKWLTLKEVEEEIKMHNVYSLPDEKRERK
jgi:hypothetical protein